MPEIARRTEHVLVVEDEPGIRDVLQEFLTRSYQCTAVDSAEEALALISAQRFDLILSDITMPGMSGLEMVPRIRIVAPQTMVVMISGLQTIECAIAAMRAGAFDYITKPFDLSQVGAAVRRALEHARLLKTKQCHEESLSELVKQRTDEVEHLATHDRLTGLPNRASFEDRAAQALRVAQAGRQMRGILFLGLDGFEKIVDTLGHAAGDILLKEFAGRLKQRVDDRDTLARFERDEFALLTQVTGTRNLIEISGSIKELLQRPFQLGDQEVYATASIGISLFPGDAEDLRMLFKNAGAALYSARMQGGNNFQFYTAELHARAFKRLALESGLRRATEHEEFAVHYQTQVDIESGKVVGTEALVRWQHPQFGLLPPGDFISLAEETGLIVDIGALVLRAAALQTRQWQLEACPDCHVAVNVSARQLQQPDFVSTLVAILAESELDPASLELELTETSFVQNSDSIATALTDIRRMGVRIAIDDFGTGYSSLSYLGRLPIDTVKLDRSFVNGATTHPDQAALVMAIVNLAHNLRLIVIAEGVEIEDQMNFLRLLRCNQGQGHFFARPAPAELINFGTKFVGRTSRVTASVAERKEIIPVMRASAWAGQHRV
jgi:diguanylate cyclase (GGDEF)-like protein